MNGDVSTNTSEQKMPHHFVKIMEYMTSLEIAAGYFLRRVATTITIEKF